MDEAGIVALVTVLADRSDAAPHPRGCFTLWLRDLPADGRGLVEDWAHRHGGNYVRKEAGVASTPHAGRGPQATSARAAHWTLPLEALRPHNESAAGTRSPASSAPRRTA